MSKKCDSPPMLSARYIYIVKANLPTDLEILNVMSSITLTEKAATELKRHKEGAQAGPEMFLRVKIVAGGCSGHSHRLFLDNQFDEAKDSRYKFHGEDVVVDKKSELFLENATLDFIDGLEQRGFHLEVPMAKKSCGCGSSYQF